MSEVVVRTIADTDGLAALRPEWDRLVLAMPRPSPFLLHAWVSAWWRHASRAGWQLSLHVAHRDGHLVGALPLAIRRRRGVRVAQFVGGHLSALADLMVSPGEAPVVATALAGHAARSSQHLLDVFGLPADSRLAAALDPWRLRLAMRAEAPVLSLERGWETVYEERTSSRRRSLHRRRRRQLARLGRVTMTLSRRPLDVEPALGEALRLHAARRRDRLDRSEFSVPAGGFQREALLALAAQDVTRIAALRVDGRAIAYHCYLALADTMYVHSLGFDPAYARYSPGIIATLDTIAAAAREGLRRVEFLGGAERFKLELADGTEPMYQGLGLARGPHGHVALTASAAGTALRLRAKRSPGLQRMYVGGLAPVRRVSRRHALPATCASGRGEP